MAVPPRPISLSSGVDAIAGFAAEAMEFGLDIKGAPQPDGNIHRVRDTFGKGRNDSGWYILSETDGVLYGAYGSWRDTRGTVHYSSRAEADIPLPIRQKMDIERVQQKKKTAEDQRVAADRAAKSLTDALDAPTDHPYLVQKGVLSHGLKMRGGKLLIPVHDIDGNPQSYQEIGDGDKLFAPGAPMRGGMYQIGTVGHVIYVAEGYATAATVHEATGEAAVVAFSAHAIPDTVAALRERHGQHIVVCADHDDVGLQRAQEAVAGTLDVSYQYPPDPGTDFNDLGTAATRAILAAATPARPVQATPLGVIDEMSIPPRPWILGDQLLRGYVTGIVAPPGVGKSTLTIQMALAVAKARPFAGWSVHESGPVWIFNNEDDRHELTRRIAAACRAMKITDTSDIYVDTGDERSLEVARASRDGTVLRLPDVDSCINEIRSKGIKLFIVDPFAETHGVDENSNNEIKRVTALYREIAKRGDCAVLLVHHTRKQGISETAGSMDSARGAGAFTGVARVVSTVFGMSDKEAEEYDVDKGKFIRYDGAKANLSLVSDKAIWFERVSVLLDNGDWVGALAPWSPPDPMDGIDMPVIRAIQRALDNGDVRCGKTARSKDKWVGCLIAEMADLDAAGDRIRISKIHATLVRAGWLRDGEKAVLAGVNPEGSAAGSLRC